MRAVLQRVSSARVEVEGRAVGRIGRGLLVFLGVRRGDTADDSRWLADKVVNLRIFEDAGGKMNLALGDVGGSILVVSQFTLYADCRRGRRPSYTEAAPPEEAQGLYRRFVEDLRSRGAQVEEGVFQARMEVHLVNEGPVTILLESPGGGVAS
ncbi:MAG TPA: D-aminoacyl-tRNA deacylase [Candidatus Nitrosotenuis sp.]|jgi:D-tyrosyl-tRNA(Tyr) deacylase|nr:D-aminoacyl-tRNA deacylase [Candidatus Nitrosotenuis sp.]